MQITQVNLRLSTRSANKVQQNQQETQNTQIIYSPVKQESGTHTQSLTHTHTQPYEYRIPQNKYCISECYICQLQELGVFMYHNKTQNRRLPYANEFALIKKRFQGQLGVQRHGKKLKYISNKHNLVIKLRVSHKQLKEFCTFFAAKKRDYSQATNKRQIFSLETRKIRICSSHLQ